MDTYIGIDIGGTDIKYGLVLENGDIIENKKIPTQKSGELIYQDLIVIIEDYKEKEQIKGIGISAPGVIEEDGYMRTAGAIHDFYNKNIRKELEKDTGLPISIENDANCVALAEKWLGSGQEYHDFLSVVVGTGIGGGMVINDQLYRGAHATAGEFGFMLINPIENKDTRAATLSLTGSVQSGIVSPFEALVGENEKLNGKLIFDLANEGNALAEKVLQDFYLALSKGIFNMIVSFDPQAVLIGGAISKNEQFLNELIETIKSLKEDHPDMKDVIIPPIIPCRFQNNAGIIGAVYKAKQLNK